MTTPTIPKSVSRKKVLSLGEMKDDVMYPRGAFSDFTLPRGRKLDEALRNDSDAPAPVKDFNSLLYTKEQIAAYVERVVSEPDRLSDHSRAIATEKANLRREAEKREKTLREQLAADLSAADASYRKAFEARVGAFMNSAGYVITDIQSQTCGVYFLMNGPDVVYVGQSVNVVRRLGDHLENKDFDSVRVIPCKPSDLDNLEGFFIRFLRPRLNGGGAGGGLPSAPRSELWDSMQELQIGNCLKWANR